MERSLFTFIWKHSKRDQTVLLLVTLLLFPLLYLTLELPKQIINGAIGAETPVVERYGIEFTQVEFLMALCGLFLVAVLAHGLLKMRINTMKGVLAERLLRRYRYGLISRMLRFPKPYFERTSQGELVSMVTAESEPMGGLMGDALAQPVLQAGQMLTILGFLFAQSVTFGLAACALIPLQAWLIPRLQKQINLLNKKRVVQVRALAAEIGEGASGASTLRINAGWRYYLAQITDRLGRLYAIRFEIYQKKFFMKFINNFITQLTPFLFYSIGGYLVIQGDVTLGALVAALAAYKDLSSPWKELLAYYNQSQDMSLRWDTIAERFMPNQMVKEENMAPKESAGISLRGDIHLSHVSVRDSDGNPVLDSIDATLPGGGLIGITASRDEDRRALGDVLTRELLPSSGSVRVDDQDISALSQVTLARKIGHASSRPVLFQGSFGQNIMMPIRSDPMDEGRDPEFAQEALRAGNGPDMLSAKWDDPTRGGASDTTELRNMWSDLIEDLGVSQALFRRALDQTLNIETEADLTQKLIALRPAMRAALMEKDLCAHVFLFDPETFCPALPIVQNLLYATPISPQPANLLALRTDYQKMLDEMGLSDDLMELALSVMDGLGQIFGAGGTDHPLFLKTGLEPEHYEAALGIAAMLRADKPIDAAQRALLLSVPSSVSAEQVGPVFPDRIRTRILDLRMSHGADLRQQMQDVYAPIAPDRPVQGLSVLENLIFGKISADAGPRGEDVRQAVLDVLRTHDLASAVLQLVFDVPITLGGSNLSSAFAEPLAISRAVIKQPDILVLDHVLASFDPATTSKALIALRRRLPEATIIVLGADLPDTVPFDTVLDIQQGRLTGTQAPEPTATEAVGDVSADLSRKVQALEKTALFSGLDRKQIRLLAFGARWFRASAGEYVFYKNDAPDSGAFMMIDGEADLLLPINEAPDRLIATVGAGALVGELGLIRNEPRALDMRAKSDIVCLRIGVEEFLAVVENDASTAFKLLQVVAGYVNT